MTRRFPTIALGLLVAVAALATGCTSGAKDTSQSSAPGSSSSSSTSSSSSSSSSPTTTSSTAKPGAPVRVVSPLIGDGSTFGIGMPLIISFSRNPTSRSAFEQAAKVTVNGQPARGGWFWFNRLRGQSVEAHYRPRLYWPAHSKVHVDLPMKGLSAGKGLTYSNDLTLDYNIGASHISIINASSLRMQVYSDGKLVRTMKVSLGAAKTPTFQGIKVVMDKQNPQRMIGPGYNELVPYSVRVTQSGEFIHDAYWNTNIGRLSTSNGCTNLALSDSIFYYKFAQIGDVAQYPNASGTTMPVWDGYGDWNLSWPEWQSGGSTIPR